MADDTETKSPFWLSPEAAARVEAGHREMMAMPETVPIDCTKIVRMSVTDDGGKNHGDDGKFVSKNGASGNNPEPGKKRFDKQRILKSSHGSIDRMVDAAISNSAGSEAMYHDFAHLGSNEIAILRKEFGINAEKWVHSIRGSEVRHILNRQTEYELSEDLEPVTAEDIKSIPELIASSDRMKVKKDRKTGRVGIQYSKRVNGTFVMVSVTATKKEKLRVTSMRKHKLH